MKRKRFSEEQIITILQEHAAGIKVRYLFTAQFTSSYEPIGKSSNVSCVFDRA